MKTSVTFMIFYCEAVLMNKESCDNKLLDLLVGLMMTRKGHFKCPLPRCDSDVMRSVLMF